MLAPWYNLDKAAQASAYFALKAGSSINMLKLLKLMYEAERASMDAFDEPMFYDDLVSMPKGPVVSITYNFINSQNNHPTWSRFVSTRKGHSVSVNERVGVNDLDRLSEADLKILNEVWENYKGIDQFEMVEILHKERPEWKDPQGSSRIISHKEIFDYLGKSDSKGLAEEIDAYKFYKSQTADA